MPELIKPDYTALAHKYRNELFENILPFWLHHSRDQEAGGFLTCLDRRGNVYDTDKFTWLQARQVWTYSFLHRKLQGNDTWLEFALHGADFLQKHGRDESGNWYFSMDRRGRPLVQPYNLFSDCFASLGFGALYTATGKDEYASIARDTFKNILVRRENSKGVYAKGIGTTRSLKNSSMPMILSMLLPEVEDLLDDGQVQTLYDECIHELTESFYDPQTGILFENVDLQGGFSDTMDGRLICPGTILEGMWFIMDIAEKRGDTVLLNKTADIVLAAMEYGWDKEFGGLFYFLDYKGVPPQQLEWDQKLWWVHVEALISLLKAYTHTRRPELWAWFLKVHEYTWAHFPDSQYGEWFGYLNRRGEVLLDLKGGKWKGCYHIPRAMYQCTQLFEKLTNEL